MGGGASYPRPRLLVGSISEDEVRAERDRLVRLGLKLLGQAGDEYVAYVTVDSLFTSRRRPRMTRPGTSRGIRRRPPWPNGSSSCI